MGSEEGVVRPVALAALGQRYRRYRLADPPAEEAMAGSLRRWGPLAPVVACRRDDALELLDGFKRWTAARQVAGLTTLSVRVLEVDEPTAKAAILGLNRGQRGVREREEAWIVQALVRDDGLTQVEAAHLLGQHKSWVGRRRALLEQLSDEVKEDLRLGLLGPALARQLVRLPAGNQQAVLALTRRQTLTAHEVSGVIDLLQGASAAQAAFVLSRPRAALMQTRSLPVALRDPRRAGNWLARHLTQALELVAPGVPPSASRRPGRPAPPAPHRTSHQRGALPRSAAPGQLRLELQSHHPPTEDRSPGPGRIHRPQAERRLRRPVRPGKKQADPKHRFGRVHAGTTCPLRHQRRTPRRPQRRFGGPDHPRPRSLLCQVQPPHH
jgi:ParB-like chromosome segregation protein Spo0J